jgi:hypothetical protein
MSSQHPVNEPETEVEDTSKGISLTLIYGLIAIALFAAIAIALFIVMPFYHRR